MAFVKGDIVKKISGSQKYEVDEVLVESKYACKLYPRPPYADTPKYTFIESELEIV